MEPPIKDIHTKVKHPKSPSKLGITHVKYLETIPEIRKTHYGSSISSETNMNKERINNHSEGAQQHNLKIKFEDTIQTSWSK